MTPQPKKKNTPNKGNKGNRKGSNNRRPRVPKVEMFKNERFSLDSYTDRGEGLFASTGTRLVCNTGSYLDLTTDLAAIKSDFLIHVLYNLMTKEGVDKYDASFQTSAMEAICYAAELLTELKLMKTILKYCPAFAKDDATAGKPLTFATLKAFLIAMESMENLVIPGISIALSNIWTQTFQYLGSIPEEGRVATYFLPLNINATMSDLETLVTNLTGKYDGIVHLNRNKVPYFKFNRLLVEPSMPVSLCSQLGIVMGNFLTTSDDAGVDVGEVDETSDINYFQHFGIGEPYEFAALYRAQNAADSPLFLSTVANAAAGKNSIGFCTTNGTSFSPLSDIFRYADILRTIAVGQSRDWVYAQNVPASLPIIQYANPLSPAAWNQRLIGYFTRHANGSPPANKGLPILPDAITRGLRGTRDKSGKDRKGDYNNPNAPKDWRGAFLGPRPGTMDWNYYNKDYPTNNPVGDWEGLAPLWDPSTFGAYRK